MSKQLSYALGALTVVGALFVIMIAGPLLSSGISGLAQATPANAGPQVTAATQVTATDNRNMLVVSGIGTATGTPDVARVEVGVESRAQTAQAAADATNKKQAAIIAALKAKGIEAKDLQTTNYNVSAERSNNPNEANPIIGYRAGTTVRVTVRQIDQVGAVLDAAVGAGANQIYGITFGLNDSEPLLSQARDTAILNAKAKAEAMAKTAGIKLGKIINISESFAGGPAPLAVDARAGSAAPIEVGETSVRAQVAVTYAIE
jgi:uncharacterized protein YggE